MSDSLVSDSVSSNFVVCPKSQQEVFFSHSNAGFTLDLFVGRAVDVKFVETSKA